MLHMVHELFAAQAARTPGLPAVEGGGESLSYAELERRANRLARHLRSRGVGPETRVGVCLERGAEMVVAVLAVLKAGGAYVPLDPSYPAERLAYTLADSGAALLVTRDGPAGRLPAFDGRVVRLDGEREAVAAHPGDAPPSGVGPRNAAYVIYTSGSTGRPKGVVVEHADLAGRLLAALEAFGPAAGETMPALASYAFDIWGFEVFVPLLSGGRVRLPPRDRVKDVERLAEELADVDAFHAVPALMREVVGRVLAGPGALPRVRSVFVGGDAVPPGLLAGMRRAFPRARTWVLYGPTEATILATMAEAGAEQAPDGHVLGGALPGVELHVCGAAGDPLPGGEAGELLIGGAGVARGYLGRAGLTAEKFVPDPFGSEPGARLYRSGDRVRRRADGALEFLGRIDGQVKIRGFRVEPGEVEAALGALPGVAEAVVAVREDVPGEKRLVGYAVAAAGADLTPAALRGRLAERLPEHMVPGALVLLERMPLNANGKTDRGALPAPGPAAGYVAPRTPTEETLCGIWAEVLGVERVGVEDAFLELGGHSLLAARVVARARAAFGTEVPLAALFEAPTVARFAEAVEARLRAGAAAAPPLVPAARDRPVPLSFAQEAIWFLQQLSPGMRAYNFQAMLRVRGPLDVAALERALGEIVRRHEVLRTTFPGVDGRPVQRVHAPWPVVLDPADLAGLAPDEREAAVRAHLAEEIARPFDLARLPLVRWTLLRVAPDDHVLAAVEHHFVHDGWSFGVFLRELKALYEAFSRGEPSPLPELPVQYADYAVWQRAWMRSDAAREHLEFWRRALAGAPPLLELPLDRPRPPVLRFRGATRRLHMPAPLARAARAFCRERGVTLYNALLAAFYALLHRSSGAEDVVLGGAVAARGRSEMEGLIGMIVNIVALRADLGGDPSFGELLERVRRTAREALDHQEMPFVQVVEALRPERALDHLPVYQAAFSFHDSPYPEPTLGSARLEVTEGLPNGSAKFDLQVIVMPRAEQRPGSPPDEIELAWEYDTDLFDAATIDRVVERYWLLLGGALAAADDPVSALPLLTGAERAQLAAWNGTARALDGAGETLHGLVEAQARRTPGAAAVTFEGETLTYAGLDARAAALAATLRTLGVGPETRVGVCMERSAELVVALLGVLKAGGAYVPLDPGYPAERLAYMLADAAVPVLLTQERLLARIPGFGGEVVVCGTPHPPAPSPTSTPLPPAPSPARGEGENDTSEGEGQEALPQNW
ncbi:MAG: amino acid adenylation domain-containing protein, partial [Gemmatimonadota bacterium]